MGAGARARRSAAIWHQCDFPRGSLHARSSDIRNHGHPAAGRGHPGKLGMVGRLLGTCFESRRCDGSGSRVPGLFVWPFHRLLGHRRGSKENRRDGDSRRRLGFPPALAHDARTRSDRGVLHPDVCVAARGGCPPGTLRHAIDSGSHADPCGRAGSKCGANKVAH